MKFNLENSIGYLVNRCSLLLRIELANRIKEHGYDITPEEWVVLNRLWQKDGQAQNMLAQSTIKDKTTVVRLIDRMERKQLVTRQSSAKDARVKEIYLTSAGQDLKWKLIPIAIELLQQAVGGVDEQELAITLAVLGHIEKNLLELE